tara:strand:- start:50 stop:964 length:915 start_codon:yes stop_codon:yes gene_type:complete
VGVSFITKKFPLFLKKILQYMAGVTGRVLREVLKVNLPKSLYSRLYFKGRFTISINNKLITINHFGDTISNDIYYSGIFGNYEGHSLKLWNRLCLSVDESVVMDIGAYSGIYSLVAASANQGIEIHAFEPHPNTFKILTNNIALNSFKNIFLNNYALAEIDGDILFYNSLGKAPSGFSAVNHRNINKNSTTKICNGRDVLKILNTDLKGKRISLIKIDIERAELPLLRIMIDRIIHDRTIVLSEILDEEDFEHFDELFTKNGFYSVKIIDQDHTIKILNSLYGTKREGFNIIFVPSEVDPKIFY